MIIDRTFSSTRNGREINICVLVVSGIPYESSRALPLGLEVESQRIANNNVTISEGIDSIVGKRQRMQRSQIWRNRTSWCSLVKIAQFRARKKSSWILQKCY
jgi:hypothetical protein